MTPPIESVTGSQVADSSDMAVFGPHVVALVDFLGQSGQLAKWDFTPETVGQTDEWVKAVRRSMGRVLMWRENFEKYFSQFDRDLRAYEETSSVGMPADKRQQFDEYRQSSLHQAHFSDTIIFYSPLANEHGYWQVSNVCGMLVACGTLLLGALNTKTVFRGAIEVGMLSRFRTGDPYGPGLAKAHYLEGKVAQYPRIVVGPTLLSYLDWIQSHPDQGAPAQANRAVAAECRDHLAQDTDRHWIVDYLNDTFANAGGNPADWRRMQHDAFAFIQSELERFRQEGNKKLVERYERLVQYFRRRGSPS